MARIRRNPDTVALYTAIDRRYLRRICWAEADKMYLAGKILPLYEWEPCGEPRRVLRNGKLHVFQNHKEVFIGYRLIDAREELPQTGSLLNWVFQRRSRLSPEDVKQHGIEFLDISTRQYHEG